MNRLRLACKRFVCERLPLTRGSFKYYGVKTFFSPGSVMFERICQEGVYERENVHLVCSLVRDESYYLDIGANIGLMAIPVLQECPRVKVVSFEPSPNSYDLLARTRACSVFRDRWQTQPQALGNAPGRVAFSVCAPAQGAYDGLRATGRGGAAREIQVVGSTLDIEWKALGCPPVSCLKIDTEGSELSVLKGGGECIANNRPAILTEWSLRNLPAYDCSPGTLFEFASQIGYGLYAVPGLVRITSVAMLQLHCLRTESFLLYSEAGTA